MNIMLKYVLVLFIPLKFSLTFILKNLAHLLLLFQYSGLIINIVKFKFTATSFFLFHDY